MKSFSIVALGVLVGLTQLNAAPQSGSRRERGQDRVCVYKDIQYEGTEQCYQPGDEITTLQNQRNSISSIRVYGRARVTVYDETNFRGHATEFASNAPDLGQVSRYGSRSWNDSIQSLRVDSSYGRFGNAPVFGGNPPPNRYPEQQLSVAEGVCVYDRPNYQGRSQCWSSGETLDDLARMGDWSDRISSIRVLGRSRVVVYRDIRFRGAGMVIDQDIPDLAQVPGNGFRNWDHQISSLQVEEERRGYGNRRWDRDRYERR